MCKLLSIEWEEHRQNERWNEEMTRVTKCYYTEHMKNIQCESQEQPGSKAQKGLQ